MRRDFIQLGRNFLLSLGGEGLQSGFHFILTLLLIRLLSLHDFGIFAIAFVLGGIALTYGNAFVTVPATVRLARLKSRGALDYLDVVFGSIALLVSIAAALIAALALWLTTGHGLEALAGGAFAGTWTLRNHVRTVMFARRAMAASVASDFSYSASGIAFVAALLWQNDISVTTVLSALAAANIVAIGVALRAVSRPRVSFRPRTRRHYGAIWPDVRWSLVAATTWNVQSQALTFLVAAIAGPAAYAPVAAAIVLFSPLRPAISAVVNVFRPDFAAALAARQYRRVRLTLYSLCAVIALTCAAVGARHLARLAADRDVCVRGKILRHRDAADRRAHRPLGAGLFDLQRAARLHPGRRRVQAGRARDHVRRPRRARLGFGSACRHLGRMVIGGRGGRRSGLLGLSLDRGAARAARTQPGAASGRIAPVNAATRLSG